LTTFFSCVKNDSISTSGPKIKVERLLDHDVGISGKNSSSSEWSRELRHSL